MKVNPIIRYARGLWGSGWIAFIFVIAFYPAVVEKILTGGWLWVFLALYLGLGAVLSDRPWSRVRNDFRRWSARRVPQTTVEDRLDELERLKRRDLVTPEEYTAKRQEIIKDL